MIDELFALASELSYFGIFLVLIALNATPLLVPPTWIILSSFYAFDPTLDPLTLAVVGATGATIGRFILKRISHLFRRFVGETQRDSLDTLGNYLGNKKFGYGIISFLFAISPLPSNMLFVTYGIMKVKDISLYVGFWLGRVISYYIMITVSEIVLTPLLELFEDRLVGILVADVIGVGTTILLISINWSLLITKRKLRFTRPKIWRL
jgi:membrane protein YqaA with SNARE-associated domain